MFAVRQEKNARQTISLLCVEGKTQGKQFFCRTFFSPYAMEKTHGEYPLCCAPEIKRTTKIFTHSKLGFSRSDSQLELIVP
jgi:hypothetical protein